jgi:hypothetical protein
MSLIGIVCVAFEALVSSAILLQFDDFPTMMPRPSPLVAPM